MGSEGSKPPAPPVPPPSSALKLQASADNGRELFADALCVSDAILSRTRGEVRVYLRTKRDFHLLVKVFVSLRAHAHTCLLHGHLQFMEKKHFLLFRDTCVEASTATHGALQREMPALATRGALHILVFPQRVASAGL